MHQVQVNVIGPERGQTLVEALLYSRMVGAPQFGGNEDVLALQAALQPLCKPLANLVLVAVDESGINVLVAGFEGMRNCSFNFSWGALPSSKSIQESAGSPQAELTSSYPTAEILAPVLSGRSVFAIVIVNRCCGGGSSRVVALFSRMSLVCLQKPVGLKMFGSHCFVLRRRL